jgi:hypothetical protein
MKNKNHDIAKVLGVVVTSNLPLLYYTVDGRSTAMALHTAILFTLWGIGLVLVGLSISKTDNLTPITKI